MSSVSSTACSTAVMGMVIRAATPTPMAPDSAPMMTVSALNTCEMFFRDAPSARSMPISLVLSMTEMWVMMPIMMHDTTRETATNAIRTYEMMLMMEVTEPVMRAT